MQRCSVFVIDEVTEPTSATRWGDYFASGRLFQWLVVSLARVTPLSLAVKQQPFVLFNILGINTYTKTGKVIHTLHQVKRRKRVLVREVVFLEIVLLVH